MNYYNVSMTGEYKVWKKYFTFDEPFFYRNKELEFEKAVREGKIDKLKIKVLSQKGEFVENQSFFEKDKAPPIINVDNVFLFRQDVIEKIVFDNINDYKFVKIKIAGKFKNDYSILFFENVINCVNKEKSIRKDFDFLSKLVLLNSKIPKDINGFFLSEWSKYNKLHTVVNEKLKETLLKLEDGNKFLVFEKIEITK